MKEITYKIKHKEEDCKECVYSGMCVKDLCEVEHETQVPETFDELKELVRQNIHEDDRNGVKMGEFIKVEYILIDGKSFMPDGERLDEDNDVFAIIRNPARMWQIIKSLIGEK